jgi:hypothetical protein
MKKITLLITLMLTTLGFSQQTVIEDFQTPSTYTFAGFEGLGKLTPNNTPPVVGAFIVADPASGGTRGLCLQLNSTVLGNPWQGAEVVFAASKIRLNDLDRTMKVDVYSTQNFTLLGKVEAGGGALPMATSANYTTPNQWQTLTFNFNLPKDNTTATNGEYGKVAFFPNWKSTDGWNIPPANFTIHVDNITGVKVTTAPAFVPPAAPSPSTPNAQVFSIYGDTGGFTNVFVPVESFGGNLGNPDLDTTAGVNQAIKMDFSNQGFGARLDDAAPIDISTYGFLNFNYYVQSGAANAGSLGHQFYFDLIHRSGATNVESFYGFGPNILSTGPAYEQVAKVIVFDSWQTVSIPLSSFVGFDKTKFLQWKLGASSDLRTKVAFFDNLYFSVNALGTSKFETSTVKMYPNPAKNTLNIDANGSIERVAIYSILGQEVMSKSPKSNSTTLQTSGLQKGTYIVKSTIDGKTTTSKLIKE